MSVKLEKENIRLSEAVCLPYCQTIVEGDVIVPDVKPDIEKILQVESSVVINQKNVQADKIYVQGTVNHNVLYLPQDCGDWSVKAISLSQEFSHSIEAKGSGNMGVSLEAEVGATEYMLLNSRKLNIRSKVGISARLLGTKDMEIVTGISEDDEIEVKGAQMQIYNPKVDAVREIIIRERLEVPSGNPSICEVLKVAVRACSSNLTLMENEALAKGEIKICTLYCPESESRAPEVMEHTVAFSEKFEIDGLDENMHGEIEYQVKEISYEVLEDSDGDRRILSCECLIGANIQAFETIKCRAIKDAYGKKVLARAKKNPYRIEEILGFETTQKAVNEPVALPEYLPPIQKMCECRGIATIETVDVLDSVVAVTGYITVNFLYLSADKDLPVSSFSHIVPFSHSFEINGITKDSLCDAKAELEHIACTINSDKSLQIRAIVLIGVKAIAERTIDLVSEIDYCEEEGIKRLPSVLVYFVKKGDTLWDVAKKYRTSMDAITSVNGDEAEIMVPGKCIYIFR